MPCHVATPPCTSPVDDDSGAEDSAALELHFQRAAAQPCDGGADTAVVDALRELLALRERELADLRRAHDAALAALRWRAAARADTPPADAPAEPCPPPAFYANGEEFFVVDCIVGHRACPDASREFRVRWLGYEASYDTWEPEDSLRADAPAAVDDYLTALAAPRQRA